MQQPISVGSNAIYPMAGIFWWTVDPLVSVALIILGAASGWYHWTRHTLSQQADVGAIYLSLNAIIGYLIFPGWAGWVFAVGLSALMWVWREKYYSTQTIAILIGIVALAAGAADMGWLWLVAFGIGYGFNLPFLYGEAKEWVVDLTHGIWHLNTGIGFFLLRVGL